MLKAKQSIEFFYKYKDKLDEMNKSLTSNELFANSEILLKSLAKEQKKQENLNRIDKEKEYKQLLNKEKQDKHLQNVNQIKS